MNHNNLSVAVSLVLILVAGLIVKFAVFDGERHGGIRLGEAGLASQLSERVSSVSNRERLSPVEAAGRLRKFNVGGADDAFSFEEVERLVTRLTGAELRAFRDDVADARVDGPGGWVRCAVHAELARRDPMAALEWLKNSPDPAMYDGWGYRQIWFSTYRGWAEVDPASALAELRTGDPPANRSGRVVLPDEIGDRYDASFFIEHDELWRIHAYTEVFAQYVKIDPEGAWAAVPKAGDLSGLSDAMVEGLLRGAEDETMVRKLVAEWGAGQDAVELREFVSARSSDNSRIWNPDERPGRGSITVQSALALERVSSGEGFKWFERNNSGGLTDEFHTRSDFYDDFSREYPERALSRLKEGAEFETGLVASIIRYYPERAAEAFSHLENDEDRKKAVSQVTSRSAYLALEDLFPAQDRSNQRADWQQRRDNILRVIEAGNFPPDNRTEVSRLVQEHFDHIENAEDGN